MSNTDFVPREYAQQLRDQLYAALQTLAVLTYAETDSWASEMQKELQEPKNRARLEAILKQHGYERNTHIGYCLGPLEEVLPQSYETARATAALCSVLDQVRKGTSGLPEDSKLFEKALLKIVKGRLAEGQRPAENPADAKILAHMRARDEAALDWLLKRPQGGGGGPGVTLYLQAKLDSYRSKPE